MEEEGGECTVTRFHDDLRFPLGQLVSRFLPSACEPLWMAE